MARGAEWQRECTKDPECREKRKLRDRRSYLKHRDKRIREASDYALRKAYGIGLDEYDRMLCEQGGRCAICGTEPSKRRLAVDHDHETGEIRGLLCANCNRGLGNFKDDTLLLHLASQYLRAHEEK